MTREDDEPRWIWQRADWPRFRWDASALAGPIAAARRAQGRVADISTLLDLSAQLELVAETHLDERVRDARWPSEPRRRCPQAPSDRAAERPGIEVLALDRARGEPVRSRSATSRGSSSSPASASWARAARRATSSSSEPR